MQARQRTGLQKDQTRLSHSHLFIGLETTGHNTRSMLFAYARIVAPEQLGPRTRYWLAEPSMLISEASCNSELSNPGHFFAIFRRPRDAVSTPTVWFGKSPKALASAARSPGYAESELGLILPVPYCEVITFALGGVLIESIDGTLYGGVLLSKFDPRLFNSSRRNLPTPNLDHFLHRMARLQLLAVSCSTGSH